jgi:hypothetical protein
MTDEPSEAQELIVMEEEVSDGVELLDDQMEPFNPSKIDIAVEQKSLDSIIERLRHDEIDMNTDFQRQSGLWQPGQMSRLIESILIRFPLPAFYFDATNDEKWLVVDGLQRLSSIKRFVIEKDLGLSGLEFLEDLKNKKYDDIGRQYQRRIKEAQVTTYLIRPGTPLDVKYSIFRRINTGGLTLNNQEIRHAMAKSREKNFLKELTEDVYLKKTMGDQSRRMVDQELALRFIAFYKYDYHTSKKNIAEFLDEAMENLKKMPDQEMDEIRSSFRESVQNCWEIFGASAFEKKTDPSEPRKRKNSSLFEVLTVSFAKTDAETLAKLKERKDQFIDGLNNLVKEEAFFQSISLATQKRDHVRTRFEGIARIINEVSNA